MKTSIVMMKAATNKAMIRLLRDSVLYTLVFLFIIVEEVWSEIYESIKSLKLIASFNAFMSRYLDDKSRWFVLAMFIFPAIVMELFAFASTLSFVSGHFFLGVALYSMKGVITIPTIELFQNQKEKLLTFSPISWIYTMLLRIQASSYFRNVMGVIRRVKSAIGAWWQRTKTRFSGKKEGIALKMAALYRMMKRKSDDGRQ